MEYPDVRDLRRGQVWFVDLEPVIGREIAKVRPCIVLQDDDFNMSGYFDTVVVVPLSTVTQLEHDMAESDVICEPEETGLSERSAVVWSQVRAISPERFRKRVGRVHGEKLEKIAKFVAYFIGIAID